jgi:hypothetical protein
MATAEAHESTGTSRGTGGRMPAIPGFNVKLRGARRWGVWRRIVRVWRSSSSALAKAGSD